MTFDLQQAVRRVFRPSFPILYKTRLRSLEATWLQVKPDIQPAPSDVSKISEWLQDNSNWESIFAAEKAMAKYIPDEYLTVCIDKILIDLEKLNISGLSQYKSMRDEAVALQDNVDRSHRLRAILASLHDHINYFFMQKIANQAGRFSAAKTLMWVSSVISVLVLFPWFLHDFSVGKVIIALKADVGWQVYSAATCGAIGALFSRLMSFQTQTNALGYEDIKSVFRFRMLLIRLVVGSIGAIILFLFIKSKLLGGEIFPNLAALDGIQLAKLLAWSVVGGFSERLVPNALEQTEGRAVAPRSTPP